MAITMTLTDAGRNLLRDSLSGAQNPKLLYVAIGSGMTAPAAGDTQLGSEFFRKAITSYTTGGTGEILVTLYLSQSDAVGQDIEEVGIFGGGDATTTLNSGVLFARALYSHSTKTDTESINLQCDIQL